jgi:signal transduction histidine kinase
MDLEKEAVESSTQRPREEFVEVLRNLIHELSQPLTSLRGSLEVALLGDMDESECRKVLEQSLQETHRMARGLETLREVLEAEDPGEDFQLVDWKAFVTKVVEDVAPMAREKGLRLVLEPRTDAYVKVNPSRVESALRELLQRVIRNGPRKRVIRIGLSVQERTASLSVCDEGLAREVAAPAVSTQPASSLTGACESTQLAWWILRRSIEGQGGWLEIKKIPPRGVCCRVYLPLAPSNISCPASP